MTAGTVHVIGGGLAGLAAAVAATAEGLRVVLHEAASQAGGRCRSFHDRTLDRPIDNGTHLILAANHALLAFAETVGGRSALCMAEAAFPFLDLASGDRWVLRPNAGRLPWWIVSPRRRLPGSAAIDYLSLVRLISAPDTATVADRIGHSRLYDRLVEPLSTAILNTEADQASARLLGGVLRDTLGRGGKACRPVLAPRGLSAALIDPTIDWLRTRGTEIRLNHRLDALDTGGDRITALRFQDGEVLGLHRDDRVILAVPPTPAARLLPDQVPRLEQRPILNAHFRLPGPAVDGPPLLGLLGGMAQWIFRRGDVASVTVSAAGEWMTTPAPDLAARLWRDVGRALALEEAPVPPWRIIKERRATLAHSPKQEHLRPASRTRFANLWLAGDWTATGLPCTLEGAVRSGRRAAQLAASSVSRERV